MSEAELKNAIRAPLAGLMMALAVAGCTTTGLGSGSSPLAGPVDDYARTVQEGVVGGALIGAAVGGIGVALTGGDARRVLTGAAIGAGVGAGVGAAVGVSTAEAKQRQIRAENELDGRIARARDANARLGRIIAQARQLAASRRAEARRLQVALQRSDADAAARRAALEREVREDRAAIRRAIAQAEAEKRSLENRIALFTTSNANAAARLRPQLRRVEAHIASLRAVADSYDAILRSL
ncbi:hypothetical protein [Salinarimonas rosea]|uniref:hypothetical protein n=1 Tax=Salinarimonas rosea TaxID=552063 RepID=UPI000428C53E|nr:hypothetical protein [Salinarimonas rosea]